MAKNNWTREELIVAFNLYCKTPFSKIGLSNKGIQEISQTINRSVSAVALKLANFARLDPSLQNRGLSGMSNGSKGEVEIWNEFNNNWEELAYESERILAQYRNNPLERSANIYTGDLPPEGKERETVVRVRVNQSFFRNAVLASYDNKCCITGVAIPELLVAGHIIPWSVEPAHRTNPVNGLCLNALHDNAFDKGLMTITPDYIIRFSEKLLEKIKKSNLDAPFHSYNGKKISLPQKFYPLREFLEYHNQMIFQI